MHLRQRRIVGFNSHLSSVDQDASYNDGGRVPGSQQSSSSDGEGKTANSVEEKVLETARLSSNPTTITWAISEALCLLGAFLRKVIVVFIGQGCCEV